MFKRNAIVNVLVLVFLPVMALLAFLAFKLMLTASCRNEVLREYDSPNNRWKVVTFSKDCDSIKPIEVHGTLIPHDESLQDNEGNIFILEPSQDDLSNTPIASQVEIKWKDIRGFSVIYLEGMGFHMRKLSLKGLEISYEVKPQQKSHN